MHILLIGCGRSGRRLAELLCEAGLDLVLIDKDASKLEALADLNAMTILGYPIDIEVLESAGIEQAAAVIAIDDNENLNIMACQIAKRIYGIKQCIARTYTPENEAFVQDLGLRSICSTELTVGLALNLLGIDKNDEDAAATLYAEASQHDLSSEIHGENKSSEPSR